MAAVKRTAADLGAYICFEDEAGQGLRPPKGRTWAPRGARPAVQVRGRGNGPVNIAGVVCFRPGSRPHFFYLVAFYAVLYYAGLRLAEAVGLRLSDCHLPETGWGTLTLTETRPVSGKQWTDSG